METTVTELDGSRIKIDVEIPPDEVKESIDHVAGHLGAEMKVPGFREGKVPPEMVVQKLGRQAVLAQAIEHSLAGWYERALLDAEVSPVGDPKLNVSELPDEGQSLKFAIEVAVRPPAELGDWEGVEVGRPEVEVPQEAVDAELERLQHGFAKLNTVDRAATPGDVLLIDFEGKIDGEKFEGGEARDYLLELGSGQVLEGFEQALEGAKAGDVREAKVAFPDDYPAEEMRDKEAVFEITAKEVREKELPELGDDFAAEASEFETLAELRDHIGERVREVLDARAEEGFRESALDAVAKQAKMDLPDALVKDRATETWERVERSLQQRGVSPTAYLESQGKTREELIEEAKPEAELSMRREAVLEAVADKEGIEVSDEELTGALAPIAEREGVKTEEMLERLRETGRDKLLRKDLRMRRALESIAEKAKPIEIEKAEAREAIWTPEKERSEKKLWTPGS
ncbi:MAG: trigger factor [Solirubrobacterales bacterium]